VAAAVVSAEKGWWWSSSEKGDVSASIWMLKLIYNWGEWKIEIMEFNFLLVYVFFIVDVSRGIGKDVEILKYDAFDMLKYKNWTR
jgi:hypothetical protein